MSSAGFFVGAADALHQKHVDDVSDALGQRKSILDLYGTLLRDPTYEDAHPEIISEIGRLASIDPGKLQKEFSKGYQVAPILEPSIQRSMKAGQNKPTSPPPVMGSPQNAPQSPVPGSGTGMDSLGPLIQTPPGMPAGPSITPPPGQVAAQADAVGAQQGALPGVSTVVPPSAASSNSMLPPAPVAPLSPRWMDPAGHRQYEQDSKAYDELKKQVLIHQIERGQMTDDRKALMQSVGIPPTAEGMAKATPEQLRMLEFMAGGNPGTSRKDLITLSPGQTLYDPNAGKTVATGGDKPPNEQQIKDLQLAAYYAHLTGADPAKMDDNAKAFARKLSEVKDDYVQSSLESQVATLKRALTPQEWNATVKIAEKQKADNLHFAPPEPKQMFVVPNPDGSSTLKEFHSGDAIPKGALNASQFGQQGVAANKETAAEEKTAKQVQGDYQFAKTLVAKPSPTNDYALLMTFIGATKPEQLGKLRLNEKELNLATGTRSALGNVEAWGQKLNSGEMFPKKQRQNMLDTLKLVADRSASTVVAGPPSGNSVDDLVKKYGGR